jgi:hypothetical protein
MSPIRFVIVHQDTGQAETGANYPGCTQANPNACDPQSFASVQDAKAYADGKGERLYVMGSALPNSPQWKAIADEVWKYVSDPALIPPPTPGTTAPTSNDLLLIGGVVLALLL